jgi:hypothetical protein
MVGRTGRQWAGEEEKVDGLHKENSEEDGFQEDVYQEDNDQEDGDQEDGEEENHKEGEEIRFLKKIHLGRNKQLSQTSLHVVRRLASREEEFLSDR